MDSYNKERLFTKEELIQTGFQYLDGIGISFICNVCISNGGSCCKQCTELVDGEGCQQRNTSCTSWLCGFLKLLFFEVGLLEEWEQFWDQIPGRAFRTDYTPSIVEIQKELEIPNIKYLGQALAKDVERILNQNKHENINELKYVLDLYVRFSLNGVQGKSEAELKELTSDFHSFKSALEIHKEDY